MRDVQCEVEEEHVSATQQCGGLIIKRGCGGRIECAESGQMPVDVVTYAPELKRARA